MLVPLSWLKDYVDINVTPQELEEKLFSCGFEVEELIEVGKDISGVVVGLVKECDPIPETHLHVCKVDAGTGEDLQICCGADNVCVGGKFPVALPGAQVYATAKDHVTIEGTMTIKKGKLRGYESCGMLCSGIEIGLTEDLYPGAGYCGLLVLPEDAPIGADIKSIVGLDDWLFDVSITANRPDCQSIFGIAREVAAVLNTTVKTPALDFHPVDEEREGFSVSVLAQDLCPRYIAHFVKDVTIAESPAWMKRRLALVGIGAISNVVDITNYILKELGQPMHAFDVNYLEGNAIHVRRANDGEKIVTLDEKEFELNSNNLVICDGVKPVALAGIMGGLNSEIRDTTTGVMFESAKFARDNIRKSSRALGQGSDSSQRYAKGVDEYATVMAMQRALHLIEELGCGTVIKTHVDCNCGNSVEPREMKASIAKVNGVLGIEVPTEDIKRILTNLCFQPVINGDELTILVPAYREDMEDYPDIAEEVIRMYGYDHVIPTFLDAAKVTAGGLNTKQKAELRVKKALCATGAHEGIHYSFFSPADLDLLRLEENDPLRTAIRLMNPINEDLSLMRTTLAPEMIHAIARNQKNGCLSGRIFEMGSIFVPKALPLTEYPEEKNTVCIGVFGEGEDFFSLKGIVEAIAENLCIQFTYEETKKTFLHPFQTAKVMFNGEEVGYLGKVLYEIAKDEDMRVDAYIAEIDMSKLESQYVNVPRFTPIPKYAEEVRDLALVMDKSVRCGEVEDTIKSACPFVKAVTLFDVYEGKQIADDKKSMAFKVLFTPKDEEFKADSVDGFVKKILKNLKFKLDIDLRS